MNQVSAEELRRLISEHQVCYEVWPEYAIVGQKRIMAGYAVELCGIPAGARSSGGIVLQERWTTYHDLQRLAKALVQAIHGAGCTIIKYDGAIRAAARRRFRQEIVLTIHISSGPKRGAEPPRAPDDELEALQHEFAALGMSRGYWFSENKEH